MNAGNAPPHGFRDILGDAARRRRESEKVLAEVFAAEGFAEIRPPSVEYLALYERGHQHAAATAFRFLDRDDRLLALRADFTPAVARVVAARPPGQGELCKYWYAGSVFRRADTGSGRFTEITQAGAEMIGSGGPAADGEILTLVLRCLEGLGVTGVRIHVSHAGIAAGLLARALPDRAEAALARRDLLRHDARALDRRLVARGVDQITRRALAALLAPSTGEDPLLPFAGISEEVENARGELHALLTRLNGKGGSVCVDPGELDELAYYTGMVFTIYHERCGDPLGRGGRYDGLLRAFGLDLPAVGFSLSLDNLAELV
jgi:ATP phosphoribosyltransferase regulatory subunit